MSDLTVTTVLPRFSPSRLIIQRKGKLCMAEQTKDLSFGRKVGRRAWVSAWLFFDAKPKHAATFVVLFIGGGIAYYWLYGLPAAWEQAVVILIFTVGPIVALWCLLFLWQMWLAPAALVYEQAMQAERRSVPPVMTAESSERVAAKIEKERLLRDLRGFVASCKWDSDAPINFRNLLEANSNYLQIRRYMSDDFLQLVRSSGRTIISVSPGSRLPGLAHKFLDELDRLSKEWGIV